MSRSNRLTEKKTGAPGYIVTFSDMITLLLTFFVMLLSMAETQVEKHKFEVGINSFRRAIADMGLSGLLINRSMSSTFNHPKVYYRVDAGQDEPEDRSIDAQTEMLRRVLMDIEQMMTISPSQITAAQKTAFSTQIRFAAGRWELDSAGRNELKKWVEQFKVHFSDQQPALYVLALAQDAPPSQQWPVSARRGQAVADFIRAQFPDDVNWPIYCWGAGPGGDWTGHSGPANPETQILITVLIDSK
ncbi:MAG TPA: hypothetical protein ENN97_00070 [Phycisphaerales bacterium]|nr:hypothetical protein [Phycisphaerales bacterium]